MSENINNLPRGRVNEVCKEWGVREDGALAYRLQSEEINEHYKGNRHRNQVVRTDYPTALNEQIKEKLNAEKLTEQYRKQAELDAIIAKKLADKIKYEMELERLKTGSDRVETNKNIQERNFYENIQFENRGAIFNELPVPPRKSKASSVASMLQHTPPRKSHITTDQQLLSPDDDNDDQYSLPVENAGLNYVSLDLNHEKLVPLDAYEPTTYTEIDVGNSVVANDIKSTSCEIRKTNRVLNCNDTNEIFNNNHNIVNKENPSEMDKKKYSEHYNEIVFNDTNYNSTIQKLSPEKYDYFMGNLNNQGVIPKIPKSFPKASLNDNANCKSDRLKSLLDLGLPPEEIREIDRRLEQELRDEKLARQLQDLETKEIDQEEKDRLLAIEAQDKELARMLQEREKLKAKRAKERARLRKIQQQQMIQQQKNEISSDIYDENSYISQADNNNLSPSKAEKSNIAELIDSKKNFEVNIRQGIAEEDIIQEKYLDENYSIPVDLIKSNDENILHKENFNRYEEGIYTFPVQSNHQNDFSRQNKLNMRSNNYDPTLEYDDNTVSCNNISNNTGSAANNSFFHGNHINNQITPTNHNSYNEHDMNSVPPYMPIQGQRRSTSSDAKKKKSKDKCAQQ